MTSTVMIDLDGEPTQLPIDYQRGRAILAMFPGHLGRLQAIMPTPAYVPARVAPGVGLVVVGAFEYTESSVGDYNELGITVLLEEEGKNLPGLAALQALRTGRSPLYVHRLPVTTDLAVKAGRMPFGFPKWKAPIEFVDGPGTLSATLYDADRKVFDFDAKLPGGTPRTADLEMEVRLFDDGLPQSCLFQIHAAKTNSSMGRTGTSLRLYQHPIARELGSLIISRHAMLVQHIGEFSGTIFGPDRLSESLAERLKSSVSDLATVGRPNG